MKKLGCSRVVFSFAPLIFHSGSLHGKCFLIYLICLCFKSVSRRKQKKKKRCALLSFKTLQILKDGINQEKYSLQFPCHKGILSVVAIVVKIKAGVSLIFFCWSFLRWLYWMVLFQIKAVKTSDWLVRVVWHLVFNSSFAKSFLW